MPQEQKDLFTGSERSKITKARVSTTDPETRVIKMPDGGFRPAYNVELATDSANGIIVGYGCRASGAHGGATVQADGPAP